MARAIGAVSRASLAAQSGTNGQAAYLWESGREGLAVFTSGNLSAQVAADTAQGIYVAPSSAPSGASGAWVRKYDGSVNVKWFGATGNGVTNDGTAFTAALALLKAIAVNEALTIYKGSPKLFIPAGHYYLGTTTLDLTHTLIIEGEGDGLFGGGPSRLRWAAGATGIRVQRYNTEGAGTTSNPVHHGADRTLIRDLILEGAYAGTEGEYHGIHLKAQALIDRVTVRNFQGDGIHIRASIGDGVNDGNANLWAVRDCQLYGNRDGLYIDGSDANGGNTSGVDVSNNRRWGINDSSFLGNTHVGAHSSANGIVANMPAVTLVHSNGHRYYVIDGQSAGASTNAPSGTTANNTWWGYAYDGAADGVIIPNWSNGISVREGGAFHTDNINASNLFLNCYSEAGQAPAQLVSPTLVVHGAHGALIKGGAPVIRAALGAFDVPGAFRVTGTANFGTATNFGDSVSYAGNVLQQYYSNGGTNINFYTNGGAFNGGVGMSPFYAGLHGNAEIRLRIGSLAVPSDVMKVDTNGAYVTKDGAKLGYNTGAGGTVTQATSKSTGVTLNKACGQITLNNTSLGADTSVSFTLTNSAIAATDVVNVSIASAATAGAYAVTADAVAAGSCRISVRNLTAGALGEALVLNFAVTKAVTS